MNRPAPASSRRDGSARERLLEGLKAAIEEKGYGATTIADIVRLAAVSKRTFYEHFPDKSSCFIELYIELSAAVIGGMHQAMGSTGLWPAKAQAIARAYIDALCAHPTLTRAIFLELNVAGRAALSARRKVHGQFASFLQEVVEECRQSDASLAPLPRPMALAVVGGVNELVLLTIEAGEAERLAELEQTARDLLLAVVTPRS